MKPTAASLLKPNLNGFVIYVCLFITLSFFVLSFIPVNVTYAIYDTTESTPEPAATGSSAYTLMTAALVILASGLYLPSMLIGRQLPLKTKTGPWPVSAVIVLLVLLVPVEWHCARLAFHTVSEIDSAMYFLAVGLNLIFAVIALRLPKTAAGLVALLAAAIIPWQLYLQQRLLAVQDEAARIVAWAYEQKLATDRYPADLSEYTYNNPDTRQFFHYDCNKKTKSFQLTYHVGTKNTSHWYNPQQGWQYYPD